MLMRSRGVSNCSGPYQAASSSGSVQALKPRSRGASKMRVIRTSLIWLSLPAQVRVEPVHACLPGALARPDPLHCLVERVGLQPARPPLSVPAAGDQPGPLEHLEVARDRGLADGKRLGQLVHGRLALGEVGQDRPAGRIREGGECEVELAMLVGWHVTEPLINGPIKYVRRWKRNQ